MMRHTRESLIAFEHRIRDLFESGDLPFLIHLSGGNEGQLLDIFREVKPGDWVFSTHRNHYHALLAGISEEKLDQLIKDGRSMFVFDKAHNFLSSSVLAGTCAIAAGVALALKQEGSQNRVWCFLGDGAEDEGHFYESVLYVQGNDLPCTFVIEDNNRSVDTPISGRTGGFRMQWPSCVRRYHYTPTFPHAGAGLPPEKWVKFKPEIVAKHVS